MILYLQIFSSDLEMLGKSFGNLQVLMIAKNDLHNLFWSICELKYKLMKVDVIEPTRKDA